MIQRVIFSSAYVMELSELVRYAKTAAWILPLNIVLLASDAAASTLDAALVGDLDLPIFRHGVKSDRAEIQAPVPRAGFAYSVIFYLEVRLFFVDIVLERH